MYLLNGWSNRKKLVVRSGTPSRCNGTKFQTEIQNFSAQEMDIEFCICLFLYFAELQKFDFVFFNSRNKYFFIIIPRIWGRVGGVYKSSAEL